MAFAYKTLGQAAPVAVTLTDLYTVPASTAAIVSGVVICNRSAVATTVRIAVSVGGGAVADKDYLCYDMPIPGNTTVTLNTGATLAATDKLRCYATLATVSFNAHGVEVT